MSTCRSTVHWWDLDLTAHCRLPVGHHGHHSDGLWSFDRNGLRVDGTAHEWKPNGRCPGECPECGMQRSQSLPIHRVRAHGHRAA